MPITILKKPQPESAPVAPAFSGEFNPMLAAEGVLGQIDYGKHGLIAMPKHNGVRGVVQDGLLKARSLKPIPNLHASKLFSLPTLTGLDGELVVGDPFDEEVFTVSTSGVMSKDGIPDVRWFVFDWYHPTMPYDERLMERNRRVSLAAHPHIDLIEFEVVTSDEQLVAYSEWALSKGFEGLVLRHPKASYKTGRSTAKEQGFMRFCPWHRDEGRIMAISEGEVNLNPSVKNELGYLKKSSHKDNKVGSGRAGAVTVLWEDGLEFNMPVPTVKLQDEVMRNPEKFLGQMVKFKFKPPVKVGGKPRFPQWEGLRSPLDMS